MKKVFLSAFALFMVCLIGFGITYAMLGRTTNRRYYTSSAELYDSTIFSGDYNDASMSWRILDDFPYVDINSAGVKTVIGRSETDYITVNLDNPNEKTTHVEAVYKNDMLTIEARPTNVTFDMGSIRFGIVSWLEDIFSGNSDITLMIGFPETIYEQINIKQGSGSMQVNELYSRNYNVEIGSGKFEFNRPSIGGFTSNSFYLDLGSGSAVFNGMESSHYNIDIGSGNFNLNKLSGSGEISMGSGNGKISFVDNGSEYEHEINMGSGNLTLYFPDDSGITLGNRDIGSGKLDIKAYGFEKTLNSSNYDDFDELQLGTGANELEVDMGSGSIYLRNNSEYVAPEIVNNFKIIDAVVIEGTESSVQIITSGEYESNIPTFNSSSSSLMQVEETPVTVESAVVTSIPEAPDAPKAPEAPNAPETPEAPSVPELI